MVSGKLVEVRQQTRICELYQQRSLSIPVSAALLVLHKRLSTGYPFVIIGSLYLVGASLGISGVGFVIMRFISTGSKLSASPDMSISVSSAFASSLAFCFVGGKNIHRYHSGIIQSQQNDE